MKFLMIKLQAPGGILLRAIAGTYLPATGGTHLSATGGTPRASRAGPAALYEDLGGEAGESAVCAGYLWKVMSAIAGDRFGVRGLKTGFASGEEQGSVPESLPEASSLIASRARALIERTGQDAESPLCAATSIAVYCYGAILCTDGLCADEFPELFRLAWSLIRTGRSAR